MKVMSWLTCAVTLALGLTMENSFADDAKPAGDLSELGWMAGQWIERKDGVQTEEHWMAPNGDMMLGMNRTVGKAGKTSFEHLRIARSGDKIIYYASPGGQTPTEFPLVKADGKKVVFENLHHAFPQRIIYWLDDDGALRGRIEGTIQGKERSREWRWEKMK